jgi:hypothetical protein
LTVSAGTAYVDVAPRLVRDFSRQVVKDMQAQGLTREVERSGQESGRRFGRRFSGGLRTGIGPVRGIMRGFGPGLAAAFGGAALVAGIKSVTDEAREAAVVGKITEARLKSTGGVANVTARQIEGLATALSNKVGVDDEAIQSGMNLMLTFKGVRNEAGRGNDIFNQATKTAVDLAAGMNNGKVSIEGLKTANIQLGKALEDPIKGITALRRSGVSFTAQQREQIKTLVESGDVLGAQKIILKAVNDQFGGTAAASADAGKRFSVFVGNLKEQIGTVLLPIINRLLGWLVDKLPGGLKTAGRWFGVVATAARALGGWLQRTGATIMGVLGPAISSIAKAVMPAARAFTGGLLPGLKSLWHVVQAQLWPVLKVLAIVIGVTLYAALRFVLPFILRLAGPVLGFLFKQIAQTIQWISNIVRWIGRLGAWLLRWITGTKTTGDAVRELGRRVGLFAADMARQWRIIVAQVTGFLARLRSIWSATISWIGARWREGWARVRTIASTAWSVLKAGAAGFVSVFKATIGRIKDAFLAPFRVARSIINRFLSGIEIVASKISLKLSLGRVPAFRSGGVVPGRGTGDKVGAALEPGEVVIPNRKGDRRRLLQDPKVRSRLGDIGGDPGALVMRMQKGGMVSRLTGVVGRTQAFMRSVDPLPYRWGAVGPGAYDCSGLAGEIVNRLTGRPSFRRLFTTSTIGTGVVGLRPGKGTFTIGTTPGTGHMAANLAGFGAEARSTATGIFTGKAARSVTSFARQFYLPQVGGNFVDTGGFSILDVAGRLIKSLIGKLTPQLGGIGGGVLGKLLGAIASKLFTAGKDKLLGGVFDQGGTLSPGLNLIANRTGKPERLTPGGGIDPQQLAAAVAQALHGTTVQLDGQAVGALVVEPQFRDLRRLLRSSGRPSR